MSLGDTRARLEREAIAAALKDADGNVRVAAARLAMAPDTLRGKLARHRLSPRGAPLPDPTRPAPRRPTGAAGRVVGTKHRAYRFVRIGKRAWALST